MGVLPFDELRTVVLVIDLVRGGPPQRAGDARRPLRTEPRPPDRRLTEN
jgi:hypothetical protein